MFVRFDRVAPPNTISEEEARTLISALLRGSASDAGQQAALKIQRTVETTVGKQGEVDPVLDDNELREVLEALRFLAAEPGTTDRLRWLEDNLGQYLGEAPLG